MTSPENPDIRWQQRLTNYQRALAQLADAVALSQTRPLSPLEQQGLITGRYMPLFEAFAWRMQTLTTD